MGEVIAQRLPNVPPGPQFTWTPDNTAPVRVLSLIATFTCTGAGTARSVSFLLTDPSGLVVYESGQAAGILVGTAQDHVLSPQFTNNTTLMGPVNKALGVPWLNFWMPAGWTITAECTNPQAGDFWTPLSFLGEFTETEDAELPASAYRPVAAPVITLKARQ